MKRWIPILLLICTTAALPSTAEAQRTFKRRDVKGWWHQEWGFDEKGDSIAVIHMLPIPVYSRGVDLRRWNRLVAAVKRVYPVAKLAREKMADMEDELSRLKSRKEQKAYIRKVYEEIKEEYTPILKRMTRTQGRVLIKLIDRETEYTAYEILKEFRGGFVAGFWQGVSRIFGHNLKNEYDKEGEDRMIEQIVVYYEAGLL